MHRSINVY